MSIQPLCACPGDNQYTLLAKLNNNLAYVLRQIDPDFVGISVNMSSCPCTPLQILQAINRNLISFSASFAGASQSGKVALVAGTQNYNIVFSGLIAAPDFFDATVQMVNNSGEIFTVEADLSTLTSDGVTVWLSGIPTAASTGAYINWLAIP